MPKLGKVLAAAVLALATMTGTASAAGSWSIGGTALTSTMATAMTAAIDESTDFTMPSLNIKLTCNGGPEKTVSYTRPQINAQTASWEAESVTFHGCSELAPSTCSIQQEISTEPIVGALEDTTRSFDLIRFTPKAGKSFGTVKFSGTCAESGEQPVNGQVVVELDEGQIEAKLMPLEPLGTTENNSMELIKAKAYLEKGKALLKLASGLPWNFH